MFNQNLCAYYRNLLHLTKQAARELNYKYVWFKREKVFVRETDGSSIIVINSVEDIAMLQKGRSGSGTDE